MLARFNCSWKTAAFDAGDVLIFTNRTLHMSTKNTSELLRVSCDTRWQRLAEPADPRFVGEEFPWLGQEPKHGLWAGEVRRLVGGTCLRAGRGWQPWRR
jgi:hypothetical protein